MMVDLYAYVRSVTLVDDFPWTQIRVPGSGILLRRSSASRGATLALR